ncbi:MAG: NAD-glutamate dehydrogenase [Xanthomonadales bacterium]|nr:NAD-glutamate dehydrogenase [Xanthomonadales bacterium]
MSRESEGGKRAILDALIESLTANQSAAQAQKLARFGRHFLRHVPQDELDAVPGASWDRQLHYLFRLMESRIAGKTIVKIENPPADVEGPAHTMVTVLGGDRPFLVDSTTLAIMEMGLTIHLVVHPLIHVKRDEGGYLMDISGEPGEGSEPESLIHFQVDRLTDPEALSELQTRLTDHLEDVALAVRDWQPMLDRIELVCQQLSEARSPYQDTNVQETIAFLRWLGDEHFTFLGYRQYDIDRDTSPARLTSRDDSALGILSSDHRRHPDRSLDTLRSLEPLDIARSNPIVLTKTNSKATVHRGGYMDYVGVMIFNDEGALVGEHRFLGLYASAAYNRRPWNIPIVRRKVAKVMDRSGFPETSHGGKAMHHIMETLPRDELFQSNSDELFDLVMGVFDLQERQKTRLLVRTDQFGRFYSCLVFIPRERFNTENRQRIQAILLEAFDGERLDYTVQVAESALARLHVIIRVPRRQARAFDIPAIEADLVDATRSWLDRLRDVLVEKYGEEDGVQWANSYGRCFPAAYIEDVSPWVAAFDVENLARLESEDDLRMSLYRPRHGQPGVFRFKVFRVKATIPLSDILPMLENMGLRVVSERPYRLQLADDSLRWIQDFDMELADGGDLDLDVVRDKFQTAFGKIIRGVVENDGFNRLILGASLSWRQVSLVRAYCKYLLQTGNPFSQAYMENTLTSHPGISRLIIELFKIRFDPSRENVDAETADRRQEKLRRTVLSLIDLSDDRVGTDLLEDLVKAQAACRREQQDRCKALLAHSLDSVRSLDDDRILWSFIETVAATLRTNYYQTGTDGERRAYISLKLDSASVPDLPDPRPWREIFVYSPRVEGVHLRGGSVARGGLRWSDRREDFRTEVLGLMKAQVVKNTLIVPVGAKGGFYVKQLPPPDDRKVMMAEVVACYRSFINGLLDVTDNLEADQVSHPRDVVRHDGDDPYLVVAADKGTATFSDIANSVSERHGFWLGDAFASGGSVGYDHKGMGITAKGAWESVKRHFRDMGVDCQHDPFTVVGIGDMSGDVFGNGMLLSRQIRLQAAFNHLHIFIDPEPDPERSFAERERLFALDRSTWEDYSPDLISAGGGVFSRRAKTITLTPEIKQWLSVKKDRLTPNELIQRLLKAPVDLLWNGGIGTYVKSSAESHALVGDRSNDVLRVDGRDLRCKVVGEGGNLGLTQLGRIEYALAGGRVNTDFIDNSAGVDCSDHEVNIKILLNQLVSRGEMGLDERNELLASMTDEVAELVLRNNYLQTQALSLMEALTIPRLGSKAHFIDVLESQSILDRDLEFLPDDEELSERKAQGRGLSRPELSVLLSYSKITLYQSLLGTDVPEDPYLSRELVRYFPQPLQQQFAAQMEDHRLRREIIVTAVTNSMVNRMGATFCLRMHEDTGANPAQIAKAYTAAREIFAARDWWAVIEGCDNKVTSEHQVEALLLVWNLLRHATRWLLVNFGRNLNIAELVERYADGVHKLVGLVPKVASPVVGKQVAGQHRRFVKAGFESSVAKDLSSIHGMASALDIIEVSIVSGRSVTDVAKVYFLVDHKMKLSWLMNEVLGLNVEGQWHANARGVLREELFRQHRELTANVIGERRSKPDDLMKLWSSQNQEQVRFLDHMLTDMKADGSMDYAKASVAIRGLEQLVMGSRQV